MRSFNLAKSGLNKVRGHYKELKQQDVDEPLKSLTPGEWCILRHNSVPDAWISFVNPLIEEKHTCIHLVHKTPSNDVTSFSVESFIKNSLTNAYEKRSKFKGYDHGSRIFYGSADGLPGLIIDKFLDKAIIQINTAGVDKYRDLIKETVSSLISGKAFFLDNSKYREKESLPSYSNEQIPELLIRENDLTYEVRSEVLQKVGFYYDHRENRNQLVHLLSRMLKRPKNGLDLFCYAGAWGLNSLKGGVEQVDFVDQGDFKHEVEKALEINGFSKKGSFHRADVFKFLDEQIAKSKQYELVLCDPPAFAKTLSQKDQALDGYSKLHRKVFKVAARGAMIAFSSCTHYVSHDEFQKNIADAAFKENIKIQLIHCGMQGWDHPVISLSEKSNYIKSYFYLTEHE